MGGETKQKQETRANPIIPKDILDFYKTKTAFAKEVAPDFTDLVKSGVAGTATAQTQPFIRGILAPYEAAGEGAVAQARRQIPRGGSQDLAVANILQEVAVQRGQAQSSILQKILDYYASIYGGYNVESQIGQHQEGTSNTKEPFMLKFGDVASVPIG